MVAGDTKSSWKHFASFNKETSVIITCLLIIERIIFLTQYSYFGFLALKTSSLAPRYC